MDQVFRPSQRLHGAVRSSAGGSRLKIEELAEVLARAPRYRVMPELAHHDERDLVPLGLKQISLFVYVHRCVNINDPCICDIRRLTSRMSSGIEFKSPASKSAPGTFTSMIQTNSEPIGSSPT